MNAAQPEIASSDAVPEGIKTVVQKVERDRSTIEFSYLSLDVALEIAKAVHETGGAHATTDLVAAHMKESANGGGFRNKVVTARIFGLVTYSNGTITLTPLGSRSVDPDQAKTAKAEAFLHVPLYRRLYEDYKGITLPPTSSALESAIVNLGVATKQKDKARQAFQRSAMVAGFFAYGPTKLVNPVVNGATGTKVPQHPDPPVMHDMKPPKPPRGGGGGEGGDGDLHPFVKGLLATLPQPHSSWPLEGRKRWLQSALSIFDLMYEGADDQHSLTVRFDKTSAN